MKNKIKYFVCSEEGSTAEYLIRILVIGLGATAIFFGILIALRHQGGIIIDNINKFSN